MALDLRDCTFSGSALPEPFVKFELERHLAALSPLPPHRGPDADALQDNWDAYRKRLRRLADQGGEQRVLNHVIEPLAPLLGYVAPARAEEVATREGVEDGGWWLATRDGSAGLRAWPVAAGIDLDAPNKRGRAYRFSPARVAARVLLAKGERAGLLTDGQELRLLLCDPARPDAHMAIALDRSGGWRYRREVPDSFRLLVALASPRGVAALPELVDKARLAQSDITKKLREQARTAVARFVQGVLDNPGNTAWRADQPDAQVLAKKLWEEGLVLIYRLLFVLKMESAADPARAFSFAATSIWRNTFSPSTALAPVVRAVFDNGSETGGFLEHSLRALFKLFADGLTLAGFSVTPLGGALFGGKSTPTLDARQWGEHAVARLLDALLWTPGDGRNERQRVHYGALDVEDLGRVYEALLELEPGITTEPMCRLRRAKLEVVVPASQGAQYRATPAVATDSDEDADDEEVDEDETPKRGKAKAKTKVAWVEDIAAGKFFLRTGLGRKSSGSYYTPHPFVRFLVQETLGPQIAERSPSDDPRPAKILKLKVLDPAMGSGHFLVEACRYLGDALYEACRLCDDLAVKAEQDGDLARAAELLGRVQALPDPNDELLAWLPSRVPEGGAAGLSQRRAEALCRRLVAVHCLYGVDKNQLAVELAKLALWLESYAEGMPLTFLDHRLLCGDSLTGPFIEHLFTFPCSGRPLDDDLLSQGLRAQLQAILGRALAQVADLEATVGKDIADLEHKAIAKADLDRSLQPIRLLAAAWSGGVMLGDTGDDLGYLRLLQAIGAGAKEAGVLATQPKLRRMVDVGRDGVAYDLVFPEVFHPDGGLERTGGFNAVVGNPPWDMIQAKEREFLAGFDLAVLESDSPEPVRRLRADPSVAAACDAYVESVQHLKLANDRLYSFQKVTIGGDLAGRQLDAFRVFMERTAQVVGKAGRSGLVVPSAFHGNAGAAGVRRLFLKEMQLLRCSSFENRNKLFEIDSRFKFALVIAAKSKPASGAFIGQFYLHDPAVLFSGGSPQIMTTRMVERFGGDYLNFPEPRDEQTLDILETACSNTSRSFGELCSAFAITLRNNPESLHMTLDRWRFRSVSLYPLAAELLRHRKTTVGEGVVPLFEGKQFHQFTDRWEHDPALVVPLDETADKGPEWRNSLRYYRLAFRMIASSTNERTGIFAFMPPGLAFGHSVGLDQTPSRHPTSQPLSLAALGNTFAADFLLRQGVAANVTLFLLRQVMSPDLASICGFLSHSALRLTCNHAGYAPLWREQLGDHWRETAPAFTWPVLAGDDARWAVRAAIDAVVAQAYRLSREQYVHVLNSFSHRSYPNAPVLCLAAFDELAALGMDAFCRKHDPYWDVPLNENLPQPVIDLPVPGEPSAPAAPAKAARGAKKSSSMSLFEDNGPLFGGPVPAQARPREPADD